VKNRISPEILDCYIGKKQMFGSLLSRILKKYVIAFKKKKRAKHVFKEPISMKS